MRVLLLVTSFNSLSQGVYVNLRDKGFEVCVTYIKSISKDKEIKEFNPDIILCPFLKDFISKDIYETYPTFVFHPGIRGDRGAYSIEWALYNKKQIWGGVWLRANELFDGGDIYASGEFKLRDTSKASIYRNEETTLALNLLDELFENIKNDKKIPQILNPIHKKFNISIDWQKDSSEVIIKKINSLDNFPGLLDEILGVKCYLFGACKELELKGKPKEILAKRDGAICLGTIDGAVWISHLKEIDGFKLPATYVLKDKLKGIKEVRIPLWVDKNLQTFKEITFEKKGNIGYLDFDFYNGAMSSAQCIRLKYAIETLKEEVDVLVLKGGENFFSNGIHLCILEDSQKQGEDGWSNINAMNNLIKEIIFSEDTVTVASIKGNAGAGGVFLALACDFVVARKKVVLNPHYKTMGLSGSEYHTFSFPKRVGKELSQKILDEALPISTSYAKNIGMIDKVLETKNYDKNLQEYCENLFANEDEYYDFLDSKAEFLEKNEYYIEECKERELTKMYPEFWNENSEFHKLRYDFVYKVCPTCTPKRLRMDIDA
ncbi:enoyl-CoA hydratase-related protein [Sulfurospirillum sp. 1307]